LLLATSAIVCRAIVCSDAIAQTGPQPYGGQLFQQRIPHQPTLFAAPQLGTLPPDATPLYLDTCPEFCQPGEFCQSPEFFQPDAGSPTLLAQPAVALPAGVRKSFFQKLFFTGTYLPRFEEDSVGFSDLEAGVVLGLPFPRPRTPLLITPRFRIHALDGPTAPDLPPRLYDAELTLRHLRKFGEGPWAMHVAVTLGHYSDWESSDADAFRISGQAFAAYESSPATTWVVGVVYLNRKDLAAVPAAGLIYQPSPDVQLDLILPRPRFSWRLPDSPWTSPTGQQQGGLQEAGHQRWGYVGGELGGGIWSIQRPDTLTQDRLSYRDFRLLVGVEQKVPLGAISHHLEIAYVFGRQLELESAALDVDLDDSLMLRGGLKY
jgi:hypothetical protein